MQHIYQLFNSFWCSCGLNLCTQGVSLLPIKVLCCTKSYAASFQIV